MKIFRRAIFAFISWSVLAVMVLLIIQPGRLPAGTTSNPYLNKNAVTSETPFIVLGMGCFWGSEKRMQTLPGVLDVEAGYAGGEAPNPSYQTLHETEMAIHSGITIKNHAEVVKVYYDPAVTSLEQVLIQFWESHNPTQGNRQGNDVGSTYRSAVFYRNDDERKLAEKTRGIYQANLHTAGISSAITTEIAPLKNYTPAEDYHQDYLQKNPLGYCGLGGTGVAYADPDQPAHATPKKANAEAPQIDWKNYALNDSEQLIAFEAEDCGYCRQFDKDVLSGWSQTVPIAAVNTARAPDGWNLKQPLLATPTIVLFRNRQEAARYTGYQGADKFWQWFQENL